MLRLQLSVPNAGGSCGLRTGDSDRDFRVKFNKLSFTHDTLLRLLLVNSN